MSRQRILVVEDDPDGRRSVVEAIEDAGFDVTSASTGRDGVKLFQEGVFDSVLSDLVLPDIDGIEVLTQIKRIDSQTPVLIMTAHGSISSSVKALKAGAYDYITKPLDLLELQSKVTRAVETRRLRKEVSDLQRTVFGRYSASSITAESPGMKEVIRQIGALADTNATVLIAGESGTGKELVARALHVDGKRSTGPFIAVNCGAFAESLLESQLFGHEKGSFTGATNQHKGAFERADGGTLFLDEIGDAPKSVQVKLLRVLEEREVLRVGGHTPFHVDVRLISASNKDLSELVESGDFREDLLYRLKVVTLHIPPLRQRREDITPLANRFIVAASEEHGRYVASIDQSFYDKLMSYDWPGNVRQLQNVIESSVIMAKDPILRTPLLGVEMDRKRAETGFLVPDGKSFTELEKEILSQLLSRYEGNRTLTAERLGISRRTIQRKIKEHNLPY